MNKVYYNLDKVFMHKKWDKDIYQIALENGSITLMARPPGGSELSDYIEYLKHKKISTLVSLLQTEEISKLTLDQEAHECETRGVNFINFQIKDHSVPQFFMPFNQLVEKLVDEINHGGNIGIHCFAGIGRTGLLAASILMKLGKNVDAALIELSQARGLRVPETIGQITWLHHHNAPLSTFQNI